MLLIPVGNAESVVLNRENNRFYTCRKTHLYHTVFRTEFDGVVNQVTEHVSKKLLAAVVGNLLKIHIEIDAFRGPAVLKKKNRETDLLVETVIRRADFEGRIIETREQQNVSDQVGKPPCIQKNLLGVFRFVAGVQVFLLQEGGVALYGIYRSFKLMRDVGDEIGLHDLGRAQLLRHDVEVRVKVLHLTDAACGVHALREIPFGDLLHRGTEPRDGAEERPA